MKLRHQVLEQLRQHAIAEQPRECCGLVGGRDGVGQTLYRTANVARDELSFEVDARDQVRAAALMARGGEQLLAVYHSHLRSAAWPSAQDIAAAPADVIQIITSAAEGWSTRAFLIRAGAVEPVVLELT